MKVPLALYINKYKTQIVSNGKVNNTKYPINPFFYLKKEMKFENCKVEKVIKYDLEEMKDLEVYKYTFDSTTDFLKATRWNENMENYPNGVSLNHLIYIEKPEFINDYKNTDRLRNMVIDIEVLSEKGKQFPTADKFPIFLIYCYFNGNHKYFYSETEDDSKILNDFLEYFKECNPDIIAGYNHKKFDLPYIIDRLKVNKIEHESVFKRIVDYWNKYDNFTGRIILDLMWEVKADLSVRGLVNNKLETIGKHFGYEVIEIEDEMKTNFKAYYNKPEYKEKILAYCKNDVDICVNLLEKNYLLGKVLLAESANVPLNEVIITGTTFIPKILCHRMMNEKNYIYITKNQDLSYYYGMYEGAKVRSYKGGQFIKNKIYHYDFSSMYPSIMMSLNLSPDTVSFVEMIEKEHNKFETHIDLLSSNEYLKLFKFVDLGDSINFTFPDKNDDVVRFVTVNIKKKEGYLIPTMKELYIERQKLNKIYKEKRRNNEEYQLEFSRQYMYKTQINSIYGAQGSDFSYFTEYLIGPIVTAFGRYLITLVEDYLGAESICEIDTDGLYSIKDISLEELNKILNNNLFKNLPGLINESYLAVDKDEYIKGYFYKAKNYILVDKFGNLKVKGNSMKSSRNCKIVNNLFKEILDRFIIHEESIYQICKTAFNFSNCPIQDFALKVTISDNKKYKSDNCLSQNLVKQMRESSGEIATEGRQISYVICNDKNNKYKLLNLVTDTNKLDLEYYNEEILKVLERFGYDRNVGIGQKTLGDY